MAPGSELLVWRTWIIAGVRENAERMRKRRIWEDSPAEGGRARDSGFAADGGVVAWALRRRPEQRKQTRKE